MAVGVSQIAFGGLNWALDGAAAPVAAVLRLEPAMAPAGALTLGSRPSAGMPAHAIRFRNVSFAYPAAGPPDAANRLVLDGFDLTIPAGQSLAIVGSNGAGKTTLAKLLCRFYEPQQGAIEVDGVDLRELSLTGWRSRVTAVFQDFTRFERSLRNNVAPAGAPDETIRAALEQAGAAQLAGLETSSPAATTAGSICRAGSGSASRWHGRYAPSSSAPGWCCSTSPPRSSTFAARWRSSSGCSPPPAGGRRS